MSKLVEFICSRPECEEAGSRYKSQIRNPNRLYCSAKCKGLDEVGRNTGEDNPNFRHGKHVDPKCACGKAKDYRAEACSDCARKGTAVGVRGKKDFTKQELIISGAIEDHTSILSLSKATGISRKRIATIIADLDLDTSHMVRCSHRAGGLEVLTQGSKRINNTVKRIVLEHKLIDYICSDCDSLPEWRGKPLNLELEHIDGDYGNNNIENLTFLCPNCHSQTETFRGRNSRKGVIAHDQVLHE